MPATLCAVVDFEAGARLELRAADSADVDSLRNQVRWHGQRMQSGECWMLRDEADSTTGF